MYNKKTEAFQMRPSVALEKMRHGKTAISIKLNMGDIKSADLASTFGFDSIWIDMEHVGNDWCSIERQIMASKMYDVDCIVRVAKGSYSDYIRPLEMDATGIMIPHIMTCDEAKYIVRTTRFHPMGRRPVDGGNADASYCNVDFQDYIKQANDQRMVIVQIEDPEPLSELDAICDVEGIDMIFFGPGDFSQGIGTPGKFDNPEIARVRELIAKTANKYGKFAGTVGSTENLKELEDMGYLFVNVGVDLYALNQYYSNIMNKLNLQKR